MPGRMKRKFWEIWSVKCTIYAIESKLIYILNPYLLIIVAAIHFIYLFIYLSIYLIIYLFT